MDIAIIKPKNLVFASKERAKIEKLENQMKDDEHLNWILNTHTKELLQKYPMYKYLVASEKILRNSSLLPAIKLACKRLSDQSFFSLRDWKIEGFFVYFRDDEEVSDFRFFSLYPERFYDNQEQDLLEIVTELKRNFPKVNWQLVPDDPMNKYSEKIIEKFNGEKTTVHDKYDGEEFIKYTC